MKQFNGSTNYLHIAPPLTGLTGFTLAMLLRTTSAVGGTPAGWADAANHQVRMSINTPSAGRIGITLRAGVPLRISHFDAASIFDGALHSVIVQRSGATGAVRAFVDGIESAVTNTVSSLTTQPINSSRPLCLGALDTSGALSTFFAGSIGEFALWMREISDIERRMSAAGFSHRFHAPGPSVYFPAGGIERPIIALGAIPLSFSPPADAPHPCIRAPLDRLSPACNAGRLGGYDVFAAPGRPPVIGIDLPVKRLPREAVDFELPASAMAPAARTFVSVVPFNLSGYADNATTVEIAADDKAGVQLYPSPVRELRATPRAGGWVGIDWVYEEPNGDLIADEFVIAIEPLDGAAVEQPPAVPVIEPLQRDYASAVQLADGAYRIKVFASRAGSYEPHVTGVDVRADGTPPSVQPVPVYVT